MAYQIRRDKEKAIQIGKEHGIGPVCKCGCGKSVRWNWHKRIWNCFIASHQFKRGIHPSQKPFPLIDTSNSDWCYLLGLFHADGACSGGCLISIWKKEIWFVSSIRDLFLGLGMTPVDYSDGNRTKVGFLSVGIEDQLRRWKHDGEWLYPEEIGYVLDYTAGLVDGDGSSSRARLHQKDNGNLEKLARLLVLRKSEFEIKPVSDRPEKVMYFKGILRFRIAQRLRHKKKRCFWISRV